MLLLCRSYKNLRLLVSACTDGIDNDCDSFYDCFDSGCATEEKCKNTCGDACVEKYPATIGARCADNPLTVQTEEIFRGKKYKFETLESKDYSDCPKEKACVCVLSECEAVCANEYNKKAKTHNLMTPARDYQREAKDSEEAQKACMDISGKLNPYYVQFIPIEDQNSCCCGICEKRTSLIPKPKNIWEALRAAIAKWKLPDIAEKFLADFKGKKISDIPLIYQDTFFNYKNEKGQYVRKTEKGGALFNSPEKLAYYNVIVPKVEGALEGLFCKENVDYIINRDRETNSYGLYTLGVWMVIKEGYKGREQELVNILIDENYKNRIVEIDFVEGEKEKTFKNVLEGIKREYDPTMSEALLNMKQVFDPIFDGMTASRTAREAFADGCKVCVKPLPQGERADKSSSYIIFKDMVEGDFNGTGYLLEPHDFEFSKEYKIIYNNNYSTIFKFSPAEWNSFAKCSVEKISETNSNIIPLNGTIITYENMTLNFPAGAVENDFELNITKIRFNCDLSLETPMPKEEEINLLNIMKTIKKWLSGESIGDYLRRLLNWWRM